MAGIRSVDTKPELIVRRFLHAHGFRYRLHGKKLPGSPDIVLAKYKVCVFVHGCFWHRHHGCRYTYHPQTRMEFWQEKFATNQARDAKAYAALKDMGWSVLIIWECGLRKSDAGSLAWLLPAIWQPAVYLEWPCPS